MVNGKSGRIRKVRDTEREKHHIRKQSQQTLTISIKSDFNVQTPYYLRYEFTVGTAMVSATTAVTVTLMASAAVMAELHQCSIPASN